MKRTILIPTDFSIDSLIPVKLAADLDIYTEIDIVLMFCYFLPDSISDLLFYNPARIKEEYNHSKFKEACNILKNKYASKIDHIRVEIFHGRNDTAFDNFIIGHKIDEIIYPKKHILKQYKNSFDPIPYIKNSLLPCREVDWQTGNPMQTASLSSLFLDVVSITHN